MHGYRRVATHHVQMLGPMYAYCIVVGITALRVTRHNEEHRNRLDVRSTAVTLSTVYHITKTVLHRRSFIPSHRALRTYVYAVVSPHLRCACTMLTSRLSQSVGCFGGATGTPPNPAAAIFTRPRQPVPSNMLPFHLAPTLASAVALSPQLCRASLASFGETRHITVMPPVARASERACPLPPPPPPPPPPTRPPPAPLYQAALRRWCP